MRRGISGLGCPTKKAFAAARLGLRGAGRRRKNEAWSSSLAAQGGPTTEEEDDDRKDVSASPMGAKLIQDLAWKERDALLWARLTEEATMLKSDPLLGDFVNATILDANNSSLTEAVATIVARKMCREVDDERMRFDALRAIATEALSNDERIGADMVGIVSRDPAAVSYLQCVLLFKGFHAVQAQRVAARLWRKHDFASQHEALAIQDRVLELFDADLHPGAFLGGGLLLDHATGIVVGETAVVGRDCTALHGVTLGGTGKERSDRHPKIGDRVVLGAGATVIGNVKIGHDATVGSQAVVTRDVPPGLTVVGENALLNPDTSKSRREEVKRRTYTWYYEVSSEA